MRERARSKMKNIFSGQTISHYRITEKLGSGGMGEVYKAEDLKLKRIVALKFLSKNFSSDNEAKKRFIIEAQSASALQHKNICTIHEIDETEEGQIFICMDYYEGETLKKKIERGAIYFDEAVKIVKQIASGLQRAHEKKIIHRDIKSENIFITNDGEIKILDFGLAKMPGMSAITSYGSTIGTVAYMSPEQTCGEKVDQKTDIWALGVVIYEMLTGKLPFRGEYEAAIIYSILGEDPEPVSKLLPDLPERFFTVLNHSLEKNPHKRYQSISEMINDLTESEPQEKKKSKTYLGNRAFLLPLSNSIHKLTLYLKRLPKLAIVIILVSLGIILYVSGFYKNFLFLSPKFTKDIVVQISGDRGWNNKRISPPAVEYLIIDDLLQSSNLAVMSDSQYQNLYKDKSKNPYLKLKGKLTQANIGFELTIGLLKYGEFVFDTTITFTEPATLLNKDLYLISDYVFKNSGIRKRKNSLFTKDWNAFINFYKGEIAWNHINKEQAEIYFKNAINIDTGFALAKLRLADVYSFFSGGNTNNAKRILNEINPQLTLLSHVDSLKAESLLQKITGNLRKVININSMIVELLPGRKEAIYDLAEAYFAIRDIENALIQYNNALKIDTNYALALNHRGYCYSHLGEHQKALADFKRYAELDSSANSYDSWGDGLIAAGKLDSAIMMKKIAIQIKPGTDYLYRSLAYAQINLGKFNEAAHSINKDIELSTSEEQLSICYFLKALNYYFQKRMDSSYYYCKLAVNTYENAYPAFEISSKNQDSHWLLGLVSYESNKLIQTKKEIKEMNNLIRKFRINNTNYNKILKYKLSLDYLIALSNHDMEKVKSIFYEFDFSIKNKVKDRSDPFDLAFFNTLFGNFLRRSANYTLAMERYKKALDYNPNYVYAIYGLVEVARDLHQEQDIKKYKSIFDKLWASADPVARKIYN